MTNVVSAKVKRVRRICSFEADRDVAEMLEKASAVGIKKGFAVNAALRKYLPKRLGMEATR